MDNLIFSLNATLPVFFNDGIGNCFEKDRMG